MGYIYINKTRSTFGYFRQNPGTLGTLELLVNGFDPSSYDNARNPMPETYHLGMVEITPIKTMILGMVDGIELTWVYHINIAYDNVICRNAFLLTS
jgi:hypothetical protein